MKLCTLRRTSALCICAALSFSSLPAGDATGNTGAVIQITLTNGITAQIYPPDYLAGQTVVESGRGILPIGDGQFLTLITDINDPLISNKGDGRFHPYQTTSVIDCLGQIEYPDMGMDVEVFILPYPRVDVLSSSACGRRVFLCPQVRESSYDGTAYVVAHEMGHVFQYRYLPDQHGDLWSEYRDVRNIEDQVKFSDFARRAYRPREIFAEDFRVLFGGPSAYFGGRVENPELPSPVTVAGLEEFFLGLTKAPVTLSAIVNFSSYPNPFNPQTELRVQFDDDFLSASRPVTVRIYDVTGALVRDLFAGQPTGPELRVTWDGRDGQGRRVASSTYFGVVEAGAARMTSKLLMIK